MLCFSPLQAFGVFTPALTIGAALGQLTGHLVKHIAAGLNGDITISPPTYAVIGAASMLSGFARYRRAPTPTPGHGVFMQSGSARRES